jgi:hypothetical protein
MDFEHRDHIYCVEPPRNRLTTAPATNNPASNPLCIGANIAERTMTNVPTTENVMGRTIDGRYGRSRCGSRRRNMIRPMAVLT